MIYKVLDDSERTLGKFTSPVKAWAYGIAISEHDMNEDDSKDVAHIVNQMYLKDEGDSSPIGAMIDFVIEHLDEAKGESPSDCLKAFYRSKILSIFQEHLKGEEDE